MKKTNETKTITCPRCNGRGHFACYEGIWGGTCFQCEGRCVVAYKAPRVPSAKALAAKAEKEAARAIIANANQIIIDQMVERFRNDSRLSSNKNYIEVSAMEIAIKDGIVKREKGFALVIL